MKKTEMTVSLPYNDYLELLGHIGELRGMVQGLVMYSEVPADVRDKVRALVERGKGKLDGAEVTFTTT